jgi:hypothetical protein
MARRRRASARTRTEMTVDMSRRRVALLICALYSGVGGGLYPGPGGGLYPGSGGGLYTGPSDEPYRSNWPPREALLEILVRMRMNQVVAILRKAWRMPSKKE